jgi:hypothetical protein
LFFITSNVPFLSFVNVLANKQFGPEMGQISPLQLFLKTGSSYLFSFPHDFKRKGGGKDDGSAASMTSIL